MNFGPIFALSSSKISRFFLFAAVVTPLVVTPTMFFPFVAGKAIFFRLMVEGSILFFIITLLYNPRAMLERTMRIWREPLVIAVSVFTAVFIFAGMFGIAPYYSFFSNFERGEGGFAILHLYAFFLLMLVHFPTRKDWISLLKFSLSISILISLYAIAQRMGTDSMLGKFVIGHSNRAPGTLGNPSYISVYSMFHLLFGFFVIYYERIQWQRIVWLFAMVLNLYSIIYSQTRGTILGLGVAFIAGLVMLSFAPREGGGAPEKRNGFSLFTDFRFLARAFLIIAIAFCAFFLATRHTLKFWENSFVFGRFVSMPITQPFTDASFQSRYLTWTSAYKGFVERPVLGWGPENFPYVFDKYYNPQRFGSESWFDRAHDFVLDYLVSGGIVLFAAYIGIFVAYYMSIIRRRVSAGDEKKQDPMRHPYLFFVLFATLPVAYLLQNLFLFDVLPIYIVLYMLFAFALHIANRFTLVLEVKQNDFAEEFPAGRLVIAGVCTVLIVMLAYTTGYLTYRKNLMIRDAMALSGQSPIQGMEAFSKAIQFYSPVGQPEAVEQAAAGMLGTLTAVLRQRATLKKEAEAPTIDFLNTVYDKAKGGGFIINVKGTYLYGVANLQAAMAFRDARYFDRARELFGYGHELSPTRLEFVFGLLDISLQMRDKALGMEMLEKGRRLRSDLEGDFAQYEQILSTF